MTFWLIACALFLQQPKGIQKQCKFEIQSAKEQVFKLAYNKWSVATQRQYTTHQVCGKNRRPIIIGPGAIVTLNPGCKVRLENHILTADSFEEIEIEPTYFNWNWNASQIFPDLAPTQFSQAMQSLQDYGLHIVDTSDIAHHLKFSNFRYHDCVFCVQTLSKLYSQATQGQAACQHCRTYSFGSSGLYSQ